MIVKPMKISPFCLLALKKANKMLAVKAMSKIPNLLYSTRYSSYNGPAPAALGAELMKAELFNILETLSLQWSSFVPLLTTQQWLWADAQLMPEQGAAESHLGHKVGSLFSYKFPWSWSRQNGQNVTGNQERHRMNTASHQLCFYSKAGPTAECMEKGHPKSRCAGRNHRHMGHSLILYSYLVSSCTQKAEVSQKREFSAHQLTVLPDGWMASKPFTCLCLRLILKCLIQDPLTRVQTGKAQGASAFMDVCYTACPRQRSCSTLPLQSLFTKQLQSRKILLDSRFCLSDTLELYFRWKTCWCKN